MTSAEQRREGRGGIEITPRYKSPNMVWR